MKIALSTKIALVFWVFGILACRNKIPLPESDLASKTIQALLIENGDMPGGNRIDIHRLVIKQIEAGDRPQTARIYFQIDFTRYPTSGLAPEYQTEEPMRKTEDHQAMLALENGKWVVKEVSLQ